MAFLFGIKVFNVITWAGGYIDYFIFQKKEGCNMIVTYASQKGGVGKSTCAIATANCLAARGNKVLAVDLDPNNSTTMYYLTGLKIGDEEVDTEALCECQNIFEALVKRNVAGNIVQSRIPNVDIIPSSYKLDDIRTIDPHVLKRILPVDDYDYIVIDTAPSYNNHTISALYAADWIFTPVEFTSRNITTATYLRSKLYDELPEQTDKWYLIYGHWLEKLADFPTSIQSQFVTQFESIFDNILDIKIPHTSYVDKYFEADEKLSMSSSIVGSRRLAEAFNQICNLITGEENNVEKF